MGDIALVLPLHPTFHKRLVYTGTFRFPNGDAAAARVLAIGKCLRAAGWEVAYAGAEERERSEDRLPDGSFEFQGFPYQSCNELRTTHLSPLRRLTRYLDAGRSTLRLLRSQPLRSVGAVILYNGLSGYHLRVRRFCRERRIPLFVDCTEWFSPQQLPGGVLGLPYWDLNYTLRILNPQAQGIFSISSFFHRYYTGKGSRSVRVPPLVDLSEPKWSVTEAKPVSGIRLVYAGIPGKKDALHVVVRAVARVVAEGAPVSLRVLGPSKEAFTQLLNRAGIDSTALRQAVIVEGRVAQSEVPRLVGQAHFAVLMRPVERYAMAGFPTKVVEALASGTPVMANPTSDIAEFVRHRREGILLDECSVEALVRGLRLALSLSYGELVKMADAARKRALDCFDYHSYVEPLELFLRSTGMHQSSPGYAEAVAP